MNNEALNMSKDGGLSNSAILTSMQNIRWQIGVGKRAQVHGLVRGTRGPRGLRTNIFKRSMVVSYFWASPA